MKRWMAVVALIVALVAQVRLPGQSPAAGVDAFVAEVMRTFQVPGISLAVVKDGQVVDRQGLRRAAARETRARRRRTLFGIASNTKVFTATALGCSSRRASSSGTRRSCATSRRSSCGIRT